MTNKPEDKAREKIDKMLEQSGWHVYDLNDANIYAHRGVVIRNFPLKKGLREKRNEKGLAESGPTQGRADSLTDILSFTHQSLISKTASCGKILWVFYKIL